MQRLGFFPSENMFKIVETFGNTYLFLMLMCIYGSMKKANYCKRMRYHWYSITFSRDIIKSHKTLFHFTNPT